MPLRNDFDIRKVEKKNVKKYIKTDNIKSLYVIYLLCKELNMSIFKKAIREKSITILSIPIRFSLERFRKLETYLK